MGIMLSEIKFDRKKNTVWSHLYMNLKNKNRNKKPTKPHTRKGLEIQFVATRGKGAGYGRKREIGGKKVVERYKLPVKNQISTRDVIYIQHDDFG